MNREYKLKINGNDYTAVVKRVDDTLLEVEVNGKPYQVEIDRQVKQTTKINRPDPAPVSETGAPIVSKPVIQTNASAVKSPLPGVIITVNVKVGDMVKTGQKLLVLEAMKMENNIEADRDGKIIAVKVAKGDSVMEGAELVVIG